MAHELNVQTKQNKGTYQCWWLSLLEILRATGKLDKAFENAGTLHGHKDPGKDGSYVYGPEWQRIVMHFLRSYDEKNTKWQGARNPKFTVMTSERKKNLETLLSILGIEGVELGEGKVLYSGNVVGTLKTFKLNEWVIVDKKGHAMSGRVSEKPKKKGGKTSITVYNQATRNTFEVYVQKTVKGHKLASETGKTEINWVLPVKVS